MRTNIFTGMPVSDEAPETPCTYAPGNFCTHQGCYEADVRMRLEIFRQPFLGILIHG